MPSELRRRRPVSLIVAISYLILGTFLLIFRQNLAIWLFKDSARTGSFVATGTGVLLVGIGALLYLYLRGNIGVPILDKFVDVNPYQSSVDAFTESRILELQSNLAELKKAIKQQPGPDLSPGQLTSLVDELKQRVQSVVATDITKQIEAKYSAKIAEDAQLTQIRRGIDLSKARLGEEVGSLSKRNIINLTIGIITTGAAVASLVYLVLGATQQTFSNVPDLLAHFIPRVSVAAFIEVFSFFFLKLYKSGLEQIKYFQNELTNVEMKSLAIESSLLSTHDKAIEKIIPQLVSVDRNLAVALPVKDGEPGGPQLSPKDLVNVLENLGKLLGSKS